MREGAHGWFPADDADERRLYETGARIPKSPFCRGENRSIYDAVRSPDGHGIYGSVWNLEYMPFAGHLFYYDMRTGEIRDYGPGKTGSAEVGPRSDRRLTTWFICFVTRNGKTYAAAIMIEEGRSGGKSCAPLAAEFFSRYFQPAPEPPEKRANPAE